MVYPAPTTRSGLTPKFSGEGPPRRTFSMDLKALVPSGTSIFSSGTILPSRTTVQTVFIIFGHLSPSAYSRRYAATTCARACPTTHEAGQNISAVDRKPIRYSARWPTRTNQISSGTYTPVSLSMATTLPRFSASPERAPLARRSHRRAGLSLHRVARLVWGHTSSPCHTVYPILLVGVRERLLHARDEDAEGFVSYAGGDQDHSCMRATLTSPLPQKWFEVLYVGGYEYSAFRDSQLQNFWVGEPFEFGFGVDGSHIVATLGKSLAHRPTGDVGVEQDLHLCPACPKNRTLAACLRRWDHGRRDLMPLLGRARVLLKRLVYLARVHLIVGEGEL